MKMSKILSLILASIMVLASFAACTPAGDEVDTGELAGTYDITMWVSEKDGVAALTQQQIDAFEAKYEGIIINAQIEGVTEADAGSKVVADVATAPDIYCFAQDQLARLVQAAALAAPGKKAAETIKEEALRCGQYYVNVRWPGGMLTNFKTIRKSINRLNQLEKMSTDGTFDLLPKKEVAALQKEMADLEKNLGGIKDMKGLPAALFVVDPKKEKNAVDEARKLGIPIVAIVDTNCDPDEVD